MENRNELIVFPQSEQIVLSVSCADAVLIDMGHVMDETHLLVDLMTRPQDHREGISQHSTVQR